LINGALAVTSTLAAKPGALDILTLATFRAINIGLVLGTVAAQVATIAERKPPELAAGGKLGGRSHSAGGNAVVDGLGNKIAEVEAEEGIVNKRTMHDRGHYTVSGTPSQIISRLNAMYGVNWESGAVLTPAWQTMKHSPINVPAIRKYYATGGTFSKIPDPRRSNLRMIILK
jgi:hypothetical protein